MIKASLLLFPLLFFVRAEAQVQVADTTDQVRIIRADTLRGGDNGILILSGNVQLRQGTAYFSCDRGVWDMGANLVEAFGHVYINDSDTTKIWSNYLRYHTDRKMAYLQGNVRLTDGHANLTTNNLEYDVANDIGTYTGGGRVVNRKSILTSREGIYYADLKDIYFRNNVELKDPAYSLKTDSLLYNTESQVARFMANTFIRDSSGRTIRTKEGYYDMRVGHAEFTQRTTIEDKTTTLSGDQVRMDDSTGILQARGRAVLVDTAKGISLLAEDIFLNRKTDALLATKKPLMIVKQDKDSFFVAADTIYSAKLSELRRDTALTDSKDSTKNLVVNIKDSTKKTAGKADSTDRYFEAYRNVRVFSDSLQSVSDSLFYSFKDSTFRLYQNPVVWSTKNQISGDTVLLYTKNKKADRVKVINNSLMISEVQRGVYNQIQSTRMDGYFKQGKLDTVYTRGEAESIYYLQDKDSAYTGVNQTKSDVMNLYFVNGELFKVLLINEVEGSLLPINHKPMSEMRLSRFMWADERRPKTKYELYQ